MNFIQQVFGRINHLYRYIGKVDGKDVHAPVVALSGGMDFPVQSLAQAAAELMANAEYTPGGGSFVTVENMSNGQRVVALSCPVITPGEAVFDYGLRADGPVRAEFSLSIAGRARHAFATVCLQNSDPAPEATPSSIEIVNISQSTADNGVAYTGTAGVVVRVQLASPITSATYLTDLINITGVADNRLCYQNSLVNWVSTDKTVVYLVFSDEAAIQSLAIAPITPPAGTAYLNFYQNLGGAHNGSGIRFTSTTATSAAVMTLFGGGDVQISGTPLGDHRITTGTTAPVYELGKNGMVSIRAATRFAIEMLADQVRFLDRATDTPAFWVNRPFRSDAVPPAGLSYSARKRIVKPIGISRPVARIKSVSKAGNTTWNIQLDRSCASAGVVTGGWFSVKGIRDFANFPASGALQVTVTGVDTLTVVSTTGTATSAGGVLCVVNGGIDVAPIAQVVQSIVVRADGWIEVTGSAAWAGLNTGDYADLIGIQNGSDPGVDGAWEVASTASTLAVMKPIFDVNGTRISPTPATLASTNFGGSVFLRLTVRTNSAQVSGANYFRFAGQGENNPALAWPVLLQPGATLTSNQGGTWTFNEGVQATGTNYALTTAATTNFAVIKSTAGNLTELTYSNPTATPAFLKLYNKATAPTSADVPLLTIPLPANSAPTPPGLGRYGKRFSAGIGIGVTANMASNDNTAAVAGILISGTYV